MSDSLFDALFGAYAPHIHETFGTRQAATIVLDGTNLVELADVIERGQATIEEIEESGEWKKKRTMQIKLLIDPQAANTYKGLEEQPLQAWVLLDDRQGNTEKWSVVNVVDRTATFVLLELTQSVPVSRTKSGHFRGN